MAAYFLGRNYVAQGSVDKAGDCLLNAASHLDAELMSMAVGPNVDEHVALPVYLCHVAEVFEGEARVCNAMEACVP